MCEAYNVRSIGGKRTRPLMTVQPLANDLGLTVDTSCDRDDADCINDLVQDYSGGENILICWEHDALTSIVEALGADNAPDYPDDSWVSFSISEVAELRSSFMTRFW